MNSLAVMIGGAVGSFLRMLAGTLTTAGAWTTLSINLLGSFLLGFFLTYSASKVRMSQAMRTGIATGVLGGFTTFSTFSLEAITFLQAGRFLSAALYLLGSLLGGVAMAASGWLLARRVVAAR